MKHVLKMIYPAAWWKDQWREGLPVGNGLTGASLYGGAKKEILQIGRHDFWYNGKQGVVPDVHEAFYEQRRMMDEGRFKEASWNIVNSLNDKGYSCTLESHIPVARLVIEQTPIKGFNHFERQLDMERALASQSWDDDGVHMHRETFVSRKQDMVLYRACAAADEKQLENIFYKLSLEAYVNEGQQENDAVKSIWDHAVKKAAVEDAHTAYMYFSSVKDAEKKTKQSFCAAAKVTVKDGKLEAAYNNLEISSTHGFEVKLAVSLQDGSEKEWEKLHTLLNNSEESFDEMLEESARLHAELYHSAALSLGADTDWKESSEELLMKAFNDRQPVELIEKLWHFGRYLFICGTAPEANPFPLYGLWGGGYSLIWCHNMANENMQMIYWHSLCGNLVDYNRSIFKYMNDRIPDFKENARKLFDIDGIYMTAGTTPGVSSPSQVVPVIINWIGAAGWIAQHYYMYYEYTKDKEYAQKVLFPYMDGVAAFYEKFICFDKDADGSEKIKIYPSVSPENTPVNFMPPKGSPDMAHPMPTTINSTIDIAIVKEFFSNLLNFLDENPQIEAAKERKALWERILCSIKPYKKNAEGAVCEWQDEHFKDRYDHRHLSHIYPVFPGHEVYTGKDPEGVKMYEKAVKLRKIDAQTGWSMAHMSAIYARFQDGPAAMECLDNMAKSSLLPNFFSLHNDWRGMNISLGFVEAPVQLDAILGYVNAVQEMLLYAAPGYISLLPALEERLYIGHVKNFRYNDGFIEMRWNVSKGEFYVKLTPLRPHNININFPDFVHDIKYTAAHENKLIESSGNSYSMFMSQEQEFGSNNY